ncbi:selenide, water dikinase SelD [Candidatus Thorarchaeota archaeon]|nr:MAG: selenide, water dikinase SelD [Candidatus Thorarchaeota archaeon]
MRDSPAGCEIVTENNPIYLDYNATTPIAPEVADEMSPYLYEHFGNPSSSHSYGARAKKAIEQARKRVASLLNCSAHEVIFTSGGTESNNFAIKGAAVANRSKGNHIITSAVEHPAVAEVCGWLETQGFRVSVLPVDSYGLVNPDDLQDAITRNTILVTIMHANNEVGTIEPINTLAEIAHEHGALMHTDAAQSVGKIPVRVDELDVDLLSLAGHKVYAPKGIGALYIKTGTSIAKLMHGADHEANRRPGTENVLEIVGLGKACEIAERDLDENMKHFRMTRDRLYQGLLESLGEDRLKMNGHPERRLPNTLNVSFRGVEANTLLSEIGGEVAASAGAACHAEEVDVSPVLEAMQVPVEWAMGTIRFSVGRGTTSRDIARAVDVVTDAVRRLQPDQFDVGTVVVEEKGEHRLTQYTHGLGCACKLRPQALEEVLRGLPIPDDPAILVGVETADDAAVYRLDKEHAIVGTVDFFTPIVDDPYWFGAISAANSLSDIYAMGAKPLFALSVVGFPSNRLPLSVLHDILRGAQDKAQEAGISIIGGHTVDDTEPKYGLAVTGIVHPDKVLKNSTAMPGDVLILTKPLGLGIITTAIKRDLVEKSVAEEARELMAELNRDAAEAMNKIGVNACTDITGFGLLGHLREMALGSQVDVELNSGSVPVLREARALAGANVVPGGTLDNLAYVRPYVSFDVAVPEVDRILLADAQTSGGLLISIPESRAENLMKQLHDRGVKWAAVIGRVISEGQGRIVVKA